MNKVEMNAIMQARIEKFNDYVISLDIDKIPIGLFNGKMGICIYFYHQARLTRNKDYEKFADKLIDSIYSQLHTKITIDIDKGLAGIALGIDYLIQNKFIIGNVNTILKEIDDKIYSHLCFYLLSDNYITQMKSLKIILGLSFYFCKRLENNKLSSNEQLIFKNLIIKSINKIENSAISQKYEEPLQFSINNYFLPLYLSILSRIYKLNFYNYKIEKIFDELTPKLKSTFPLLHSNRMLLSGGMKCVSKVYLNDWQEHIELIGNNIDNDRVINLEFRNKNIYLEEGIAGYYFLTKLFHQTVDINYGLLCRKLYQSQAWDECLTNDNELLSRIGLFNGFCGAILAYQNLLTNNQL